MLFSAFLSRPSPQKKKFKHRFWNEICDGAKLFYLSGLINGKYPKREILNLSRFISVTKFRPLLWRNTHSYVVADRIEDLTNPTLLEDDPKCDRRVVVYGYVRGTYLKPTQKVHVMGVGDFNMHSVQVLDDPCPLKSEPKEGVKRRSLNEKEKLLYAPMSDVGDVLYDADATYINLHDKHIHFSRAADIVAEEDMEDPDAPKKEWKPVYDKWGNVLNKPKAKFDAATMIPSEDASQLGEGQQIVRAMQDISKTRTLDKQMEESGLQLFKGSAPLYSKDFEGGEDDEDAEGKEDGSDNDSDVEAEDRAEAERTGGRGELRTKDYRDTATGRVRRKVLAEGETGEEEDEDDAEDGDDDAAEDEEEMEGEDGEDGEEDGGDDDDYYNDAPRSARATEGEEDEDEEDGEEDQEDGDDAVDDDDIAMDDAEAANDGEERKSQWKDDLVGKAARNFGRKVNLMELVYGQDATKANNRARLAQRKAEMKSSLGGAADGDKKLTLFESDSEDEDNEGLTNAERREGAGQEDESFFSRVGDRDVTNDDLDSVRFNTLSLAANRTSIDFANSSASATRSLAPGSALLSQLHPTRDWSTKDVFESIRNKFVTGDWSEAADKAEDDSDDDDFGRGKSKKQMDSDEEEDAKKLHRKDRKNRKRNAAAEASKKGASSTETGESDADDAEDSEDEDAMNAKLDRESGDILGQLTSGDISISGSGLRKGETEEQAAARRLADKAALKNAFDSSYDLKRKRKSEGGDVDVTGENEAEPDFLGAWNDKQAKQAAVNSEFGQDAASAQDRLNYEGARSGTYVRIELLRMPCEFITHFDPSYPLILGGLLPAEDNLGFMQIRIKKHRWHKKVSGQRTRLSEACVFCLCSAAARIAFSPLRSAVCVFLCSQILKTNDPLIFSIGWRRFQVMPVYSLEDKNNRARFLKYTPEHMHCIATIYGPITSQGTGILAYANSTTKLANFRVSATGVMLEPDHTFKIVKKLKLTGTPYKIFKVGCKSNKRSVQLRALLSRSPFGL